MDFRIDLYKIFNTVAQCKSFSKAADELFMTQSAISQSIKQLENSLNISLFQRTFKGVELTEAGNVLYKCTSSAMELLDTGLLKLKALQDLEEGELKIGASDTITSHFLLISNNKFIIFKISLKSSFVFNPFSNNSCFWSKFNWRWNFGSKWKVK